MGVDNSAMFMEFGEALKSVELCHGSNNSLNVVMHVKGQRAGVIEGESSREFPDGKHRHDVLGYYFSSGTPSDAGTGQAKGRRRYSAVRIIRNSDAASAKLMSAFGSNDQLAIELSSFRIGGASSKETKPVLTVRLDNARVKTFTMLTGSAMPSSSAVEVIEILFRSISIDSASQTNVGQSGSVSSFQDSSGED